MAHMVRGETITDAWISALDHLQMRGQDECVRYLNVMPITGGDSVPATYPAAS